MVARVSNDDTTSLGLSPFQTVVFLPSERTDTRISEGFMVAGVYRPLGETLY